MWYLIIGTRLIRCFHAMRQKFLKKFLRVHPSDSNEDEGGIEIEIYTSYILNCVRLIRPYFLEIVKGRFQRSNKILCIFDTTAYTNESISNSQSLAVFLEHVRVSHNGTCGYDGLCSTQVLAE